MDKIKKIIGSVWFVPVISILLFSLIVFFAGPYFAFAEYYPLASLSSRLIVILVVLFIYLLVQFIKYYRKMKAQQKMVEDIVEDNSVNEVIDAESAELKAKFNQAFGMLKTKKGGGSSLIELPWYMIIGSPGSGKTTLLSNSGLNFPLANEFSNQAVQGVGGTKNCDWWITQDAVLLDTAGRYSSQDSHQKVDESGWTNFLGLIKKYRRKPISGLLVSFSMSDLMTMSEYELNQHVLLLKQRIAEVNDFFATKFPIYLVVTKSDMLAGFSQFYETFSHKEREQTFGITFDKKDSMLGEVSSRFDSEFKRLTQSITRRQWQRISLERDPSRKSLIYSFSDQFSSLKPTLANIINILSSTDDKLTSGILRGVYFTSGTQHGAPIDRIIASMSNSLGLKNTAKALWNNDQRSYFIKELLQQVVFPESDQFGVLTGYENRKSLIKKGVMAAAGVVTLALCIGLFVSYSNNSSYIAMGELSVEQWSKQYENSGAREDVRSYIPALNDFANNINGLVEKDEEQFSGMGLGQSDSLSGALTASYTRLLQTVLLPYVKEQVELQLQNNTNVSEKYQALKTYLMLSNTENRDDEFLSYWLSKNLNNSQFFSDTEYVQLTAHSDNLVQNNMSFTAVNEQLIEQARTVLRTQPIADIYYQQFKIPHINDKGNYLSMAQLAGTDWRTVFNVRGDDILTVSKLYTPAMFSTVLTKDIAQYLIKLENEAWILGEGNVVDKLTLADKIQRSYARDYINNWQNLVKSVSVKPANNISALNSALILSSSIDSPLFALLESVSQATKLVEIGNTSKITDLSARASSISSKANKLNELRSVDTPDYLVTAQFSKLHELMAKDNKALVQQRFTSIIGEISAKLNFDLNNDEVNSNENIVGSLEAFSFSQVEPLNAWGAQLARNIKSAQNQNLRIKLSNIWQQNVLSVCNDAITFKYPFESSSNNDATLRDLKQVFGATGATYQFFTEYLQPLLKSRSYPWQWKSNVAATYGFSKEVLPFFEKISRVRDSLFIADGDRAQLNLALKPMFLDSRLAKFNMNIHGKSLTYQFGRPVATNVVWPPANFGSNTQYSFVRRDNSEVIETESGLFALFRLIDKADVNQTTENKAEITFSKSEYKAIYEIIGAGSTDPLVFKQLSNFRCISKL